MKTYESNLDLRSAGPRRLEVIRKVGQLLNLTMQEARNCVDIGNLCLLEDLHFSDSRLTRLRDEFLALGADVTIERGLLKSRLI